MRIKTVDCMFLAMSTISLKITITELGVTKTLQFYGDKTIVEVLREVREKIGDTTSGQDHGLFNPENKKWLLNNKTLDFYDLKSGDTVEYKKKHRLLKIKMMDNTFKTIIVDESTNVASVTDSICRKIGITNPEEFSLAFDRGAKSVSASVESLNKREKIKDKETIAVVAVQWLNPEKCMPEQGVEDSEVLLLKKKFFFSDQNIDRNDPIQLNLLYVQSRDAVLSGEHICTPEEACQLAAMQLQVQFGNHDAEKLKKQDMDIATLLPPTFHKKKELLKLVFSEHKKLQGMKELNAKYRYVQICRSLKTYGITYFYVKEKLAGRTKFVPRLLGVTRESVVRVDCETKEILKFWPIGQLKRWAATPTTFTLDFGDYADAFYCVQTSEGESISQLISGYIDIIMRRKKEGQRSVDLENEETAAIEENFNPSYGTSISLSRTAHSMGSEYFGGSVAHLGSFQSSSAIYNQSKKNIQISESLGGLNYPAASYNDIPGFGVVLHGNTETQNSLLQAIHSSVANLNASTIEVKQGMGLVPTAEDFLSGLYNVGNQIGLENIGDQISLLLANVCSVLNQASGINGEIEPKIFASSVLSISTCFSILVNGLRHFASLPDGQAKSSLIQESIISLATGLSKFLNAAQPAITGNASRQELMISSKSVGAVLLGMLKLLDRELTKEDHVKKLMDFGKEVNLLVMNNLLTEARNVAIKCIDGKSQQDVINCSKNVATASAQLIACLELLAPVVGSPACQDQVADSINIIQDNTVHLIRKSQGSENKQGIQQLILIAKNLDESLADILMFMAGRTKSKTDSSEMERQFDMINSSCMEIKSSLGDSFKVSENGRNLVSQLNTFVSALKAKAVEESSDVDKKKFMSSAVNLADTASKISAMFKEGLRLDDFSIKSNFLGAIQTVQNTASFAFDNSSAKRMFSLLARTVKEATSNVIQLSFASQQVSSVNKNPSLQLPFNQKAKKSIELTSSLLNHYMGYLGNPDNRAHQIQLLKACERYKEVVDNLTSCAKSVLPFVGDFAVQSQLSVLIFQNIDSLRNLEDAIDEVKNISSQLEMEAALDLLLSAKTKLNDPVSISSCTTLGFETVEDSQVMIQKETASLNLNLNKIANIIANNESLKELGSTSFQIVEGLTCISDCLLFLAGSYKDRNSQLAVIGIGTRLIDLTGHSITLAYSYSSTNNEATKQQFTVELKQVQDALLALVDSLPVMREFTALLNALKSDLPLQGTANFDLASLQPQLNLACSDLATKLSNICQILPKQAILEILNSAKELNSSFSNLSNIATSLSSASSDSIIQTSTQASLNAIKSSLSKLFMGVKGSAVAPVSKIQMATFSKSISDSLMTLLESFSQLSPGQAECNSALQTISVLGARLEDINGNLSFCRKDYGKGLMKINEIGKNALTSLVSLVSFTQQREYLKAAGLVLSYSKTLSDLMNENFGNICLIGLEGNTCFKEENSFFDYDQLIEAIHDTKMNCNQLNESNVKALAPLIAKSTSAICQICKSASQKVSGAEAKNQFANLSKNVALSISTIVPLIKSIEKDAKVLPSLQEAVKNLPIVLEEISDYASLPEFHPKVATSISESGLAKQKPLIGYTKMILSSSKEMAGCIRSLCLDSSNEASVFLISAHSKTISESIQTLIQSLKALAPGEKECNESIQMISFLSSQIDACLVQLSISGLPDVSQKSTDEVLEAFTGSIRELKGINDSMIMTCQTNRLKFGEASKNLAESFQQIIPLSVDLAAKNSNVALQAKLLEKTKEITNMCLNFLCTCRSSLDSAMSKDLLAQQKSNIDQVISSLTMDIEGGNATYSKFGNALDIITQKMRSLDLVIEGSSNMIKTENYDSFDQTARSFVESISSIVSQQNTPESLAEGGHKLSLSLGIIFDQVASIASSYSDKDSRKITLESLREFGDSTVKFVQCLKASFQRPNDADLRQKLANEAREVSTKVSHILGIIKTGGENPVVLNFKEIAQNILCDLQGNIIYAQAGHLNPIASNCSPEDCTDTILIAAKNLLELEKAIVSSSAQGNTVTLNGLVTDAISQLNILKEGSKNLARLYTSNKKVSQLQLLQFPMEICQNMEDLVSVTFNLSKNGKGASFNISEVARRVTQTISEFVKVVRGEQSVSIFVPSESSQIDDPNSQAEKKLLDAVCAVEDAARKLKAVTLSAFDSPTHQYESSIVACASAIAESSASLIRDATIVQREIVAKGKCNLDEGKKKYYNDGQWNEGLVSAAKFVASYTADLCDNANSALKGLCKSEKVAVSIRNVSSAVAQLVSAASIHNDGLSKNQEKLRSSARNVSLASERLLQAIDGSISVQDTSNYVLKKGITGSKVQEMEAQIQVLEMEKGLQKAREKLAGLRKGKYV